MHILNDMVSFSLLGLEQSSKYEAPSENIGL